MKVKEVKNFGDKKLHPKFNAAPDRIKSSVKVSVVKASGTNGRKNSKTGIVNAERLRISCAALFRNSTHYTRIMNHTAEVVKPQIPRGTKRGISETDVQYQGNDAKKAKVEELMTPPLNDSDKAFQPEPVKSDNVADIHHKKIDNEPDEISHPSVLMSTNNYKSNDCRDGNTNGSSITTPEPCIKEVQPVRRRLNFDEDDSMKQRKEKQEKFLCKAKAKRQQRFNLNRNQDGLGNQVEENDVELDSTVKDGTICNTIKSKRKFEETPNEYLTRSKVRKMEESTIKTSVTITNTTDGTSKNLNYLSELPSSQNIVTKRSMRLIEMSVQTNENPIKINVRRSERIKSKKENVENQVGTVNNKNPTSALPSNDIVMKKKPSKITEPTRRSSRIAARSNQDIKKKNVSCINDLSQINNMEFSDASITVEEFKDKCLSHFRKCTKPTIDVNKLKQVSNRPTWMSSRNHLIQQLAISGKVIC